MNELHKSRIRRTRIIWLLGVTWCLILVLGIGGIFLHRSNQKKQYTAYIEKADNYFKTKNYEKAIVAYRSAIEVNKKMYRPYEGLGEAYIAQGEYARARLALNKGISETDSAILRQLLEQVSGKADENGKTMEKKLSHDEEMAQWNQSMINTISGHTYRQYTDEYGEGTVNLQKNECTIRYDALGIQVCYTINAEENVINGSTGRPFDGRVPSYVIVDDLSALFYQCEDGMSAEEVREVTGKEPEIADDDKGGWYLDFEYMNCKFQIACDADGFVSGPAAENRVIPLAKSLEDDMGTIMGTVVDAVTGNVLEDVTVNIRSGPGNEDGAVMLSAVSDSNGEIRVNVPPGTYTLEMARDGYITEYEEVSAQQGSRHDFGTKIISPNLGEGEWRIVLEWGDQPRDLDSHLVASDYHVFFQSPMAGSKASLDVDDIDGNGPETITITEFDLQGHYDYYVRDYTNAANPDSNALQNSGAIVKVYLPNGDTREYSVPGGSGNLWHVFSIDQGEIQEAGELTAWDI